MTVFDMLFMFCMLVSILSGIAFGVHFAYRLADTRIADDSPYVVQTTVRKNISKADVAKVSTNKSKQHRKNESSQDDKNTDRCTQPVTLLSPHTPIMSYTEFDCANSGKSYQDKLTEQMRHQEENYGYIQREQETINRTMQMQQIQQMQMQEQMQNQ